jgi:hypothetical protein
VGGLAGPVLLLVLQEDGEQQDDHAATMKIQKAMDSATMKTGRQTVVRSAMRDGFWCQ